MPYEIKILTDLSLFLTVMRDGVFSIVDRRTLSQLLCLFSLRLLSSLASFLWFSIAQDASTASLNSFS